MQNLAYIDSQPFPGHDLYRKRKHVTVQWIKR